jgi:NAD(P)-dependent dehydrogenase (short-subunit alcohol dehydrogenase family)
MTDKHGWTLADAPQLDGKAAIVTGGTGGLGYETALGLARQGADTVLAARDPAKGEQALARIRREVPAARVRFELLDLASLTSVAAFAERLAATGGGAVDILVNNAGIMGLPTRAVTQDGLERQMGVNYLAHFVLTARLKPALAAGARVVNLASVAHRRVTLDLNDLMSEHGYDPRRTYGMTKLAMLVFSLELNRRAVAGGWNFVSIAAHPGWAKTDIVMNGLGADGPSLKARIADLVFGLVAQSAKNGALPSLYAAMSPEAKGGEYYGPTGPGETRGPPGPARIYPQALDPAVGPGLWALSEKLTGATFN